MSLTLVLALQTAAAAAAPAAAPSSADPPVAAIDFDLARYRPTEGAGCSGAAAADVVVCGPRRGGAYQMDHWSRIFGPERPIRAEVGLGGGATANVHAEQKDYSYDRGLVANRVMVEIKLPF